MVAKYSTVRKASTGRRLAHTTPTASTGRHTTPTASTGRSLVHTTPGIDNHCTHTDIAGKYSTVRKRDKKCLGHTTPTASTGRHTTPTASPGRSLAHTMATASTPCTDTDMAAKYSTVREGNVDANGLRFCRACCKHIPTSHFPAGQRRFLCKRHIWEKIGKAAKARLRSDPLKRELARLWSLCYNDRGLFCQTRVAITQTDIARLLVNMAQPASSCTTTKELSAQYVVPSERRNLAVVPIRPQELLSKTNAVLVQQEDRGRLLGAAKERDFDAYTGMVRVLLPEGLTG